MVKNIFLGLAVFLCQQTIAQKSIGSYSNELKNDYLRPGTLKGTSTISPASMLNRSFSNIYLSGFLEYHIDKKISVRGESFWFVDGQSKTGTTNNAFIDKGMRVYMGVFYHTNKKNWDKYIGFQPGIALMKPLSTIEVGAPFQVCPSFALHVGSTYYVWKYFNFFVDLAYVKSSYRGLAMGTQKTDEMILSAGLGFQIQTKNKY